jgi:hypothetical protein
VGDCTLDHLQGVELMIYQKAQEALANGLLAKREKWPDSTWLSPSFEGAAFKYVRVRMQKPFERGGDYTIYLPTQEDLDATDWVCRPS